MEEITIEDIFEPTAAERRLLRLTERKALNETIIIISLIVSTILVILCSIRLICLEIDYDILNRRLDAVEAEKTTLTTSEQTEMIAVPKKQSAAVGLTSGSRYLTSGSEYEIYAAGNEAKLADKAADTAEDKTTADKAAVELTAEEYDLLCRCVEAESGNQSLLGRQLVADVILNRVRDEDFPDTITEVITQKHQFSSYTDGGMAKAEISDTTIKAVESELESVQYPGVIFFRTGHYHSCGTPWKKIGAHYFSTK